MLTLPTPDNVAPLLIVIDPVVIGEVVFLVIKVPSYTTIGDLFEPVKVYDPIPYLCNKAFSPNVPSNVSSLSRYPIL